MAYHGRSKRYHQASKPQHITTPLNQLILALDRNTWQQYSCFSSAALFPQRNCLHFPSSSTVYFDVWIRQQKCKGDFPMHFRLNKHSPDNYCLILCDTITMKMFDSFGNTPFQHSREFPEMVQNGCLLLVSSNYTWNISNLQLQQEVPSSMQLKSSIQIAHNKNIIF